MTFLASGNTNPGLNLVLDIISKSILPQEANPAGAYIHLIWVLGKKILTVFPLWNVKLKVLYNILFKEVIHSILKHQQRLLTEPERAYLKLHEWIMAPTRLTGWAKL